MLLIISVMVIVRKVRNIRLLIRCLCVMFFLVRFCVCGLISSVCSLVVVDDISLVFISSVVSMCCVCWELSELVMGLCLLLVENSVMMKIVIIFDIIRVMISKGV